MTEKEKMMAGTWYDAADPELESARKNARILLHAFNHSSPEEVDKREIVLQQLLGTIKGALCIEPPFACDYGFNIFIESNFYANFGCVFLDCAPIYIGSFVKFGPGVQLYTPTHPIDPTIRQTGIEQAKPIRIGNNCWLGGNVTVCPGVTIGENSIIGAGSVVVKDIPANVIAAGNPCRVLRKVENPL